MLRTGRRIGLTIKNAGRLRTIVGVFARHGFQNLGERLRLGRFLLERLAHQDLDQYTVPERARMAFEQLGPTFIKLGQLLATRPDLIPQEFAEEFKKLHHTVKPLPFAELEKTLDLYGKNRRNEIFSHIAEHPIGGGSIAQVHRARLISGEEVVVKIQRPGVVTLIRNDIDVLYQMAALLQKYVPEVAVYNPTGIVDEFFRTLQLETDFFVEANNLRRFAQAFRDNSEIVVPKVYMELTTREVLVMEALRGLPLSDPAALSRPGVDREKILQVGLNAYLKMVFRDGFFHGDLHPGNFFILEDGRVGLVDFGIVGRLSQRAQDAIVNMLMALAVEDYERLAFEYVDIAPYTEGLDIDRFAKDLRNLVAPYYGLTLRNINVGKLLMNSASVASDHRVVVPTELMLYFRSMVAIEGLARTVKEDFDFHGHALKFVSDLMETRYDPKKWMRELTGVARDSTDLLYHLPRQIKQIVRRLNSPDFVAKFRLQNLPEIRRAIQLSANLLFLGLVIVGLLISGALALPVSTEYTVLGISVISASFFALAGFLGFIAFIQFLRK